MSLGDPVAAETTAVSSQSHGAVKLSPTLGGPGGESATAAPAPPQGGSPGTDEGRNAPGLAAGPPVISDGQCLSCVGDAPATVAKSGSTLGQEGEGTSTTAGVSAESTATTPKPSAEGTDGKPTDAKVGDPAPPTTDAKSASSGPAGVLLALPASLPGAPFAVALEQLTPVPAPDDLAPLVIADETGRARPSDRGAELPSGVLAASPAGAESPPSAEADADAPPVPIPGLDPEPEADAPKPPKRPPEPLTFLGVPLVGAWPLDLTGVEDWARGTLGAVGVELPPDEAGSDTYAWLVAAVLLAGGAAYGTLRRPPRAATGRGLGPDSAVAYWGMEDGHRFG